MHSLAQFSFIDCRLFCEDSTRALRRTRVSASSCDSPVLGIGNNTNGQTERLCLRNALIGSKPTEHIKIQSHAVDQNPAVL